MVLVRTEPRISCAVRTSSKLSRSEAKAALADSIKAAVSASTMAFIGGIRGRGVRRLALERRRSPCRSPERLRRGLICPETGWRDPASCSAYANFRFPSPLGATPRSPLVPFLRTEDKGVVYYVSLPPLFFGFKKKNLRENLPLKGCTWWDVRTHVGLWKVCYIPFGPASRWLL